MCLYNSRLLYVYVVEVVHATSHDEYVDREQGDPQLTWRVAQQTTRSYPCVCAYACTCVRVCVKMCMCVVYAYVLFCLQHSIDALRTSGA